MPFQEIQKLNGRHFKIMELYLDGRTVSEIAKELSMRRETVGVLINSSSFQHEIALRRGQRTAIADERAINEIDEAKSELRKNALLAAQRLTSGLHQESFVHQKAAATEILDRVGIGKVTKSEVDVKAAHVVLSPEDAKVLQETLRMVV